MSSSIIVLTPRFSPGASQLMCSVVRPCSWSISTTRQIPLPEERSSCSSSNLLLHGSASLAANRCCLESKTTGLCERADSDISAPGRVVGSAPRTDVACGSRRSWRSSRQPTFSGSHQSSLAYSATAWALASWMTLTLSGTILNVFVRVRSLTLAALAFFTHWLWCSINARCASIYTHSKRVACGVNGMNPF